MLLVPVLLLLPRLWCGLVWGGIVLAAFATNSFFSPKQKKDLADGVVHMAQRANAGLKVLAGRGRK